jgi:hypothetical protein
MNDWTVATLKEHHDAKITALEKQLTLSINSVKDNIAVALAASEKAIGKAELASERRFEGVNEFRATLSDQAATFLPRAEYSVQHKSMADRLDAMEKQRSGSLIQIISACAALAAVISVIVVLTRHI